MDPGGQGFQELDVVWAESEVLAGPETQTEMGKTGWEGTGCGADTARSDKGTDDGMKMGSPRGCWGQPVDTQRTMGETDVNVAWVLVQ